MKDGLTIWRERLQAYWNEAIRYLRLIGNSGFLFTVYVLIIIGSYYYSVFIDWLPASFPVIWVFVAVFAHFLTRGQIRTFVKPADVVFLLPYESQLGSYFKASKWYSFALQSGVILLVLIVFAPLYQARLDEAGSVVLIFGWLLAAKGWNVLASWEEQRFQSEADRRSHFLLRGLINLVFTYLLFAGANRLFLLAILVLMLVLYLFYYRKLAGRLSLKWPHLIEVEERMLLFFYRIANAFTDVPQLRNKVKERRAFNWLIGILMDSKASVYHYLFVRSFLRANDYAGIYLRLLLIGAGALIVLPTGWIQILVLVLFMHLITKQLSTLWYHYDTTMWVDLYPVEDGLKEQAISQLAFRLLACMTACLTGLLLIISTGPLALAALGVGALYTYLGSQMFIHQRKK
ncbi:ABC transporter permease [Alkalihalobacillus oceani]|uniref:ABC transporter permease n=1 Tax=Halalkalibacter oceani TaxID=1653776 RepID=A0A9X2INI8_9BACI|nr:ABC transporter permease [Halalkalibacter oceani]MCM3712643.1 ABC transporter permease [Halalkalibacter oceani]